MDEKNLEVRPRDGRLALFINDWNVADLFPHELTPSVSWAILHAYELGAMQMANRMQTQIAALDRTFRPGTAFELPSAPKAGKTRLPIAEGLMGRGRSYLAPIVRPKPIKKKMLRGIR